MGRCGTGGLRTGTASALRAFPRGRPRTYPVPRTQPVRSILARLGRAAGRRGVFSCVRSRLPRGACAPALLAILEIAGARGPGAPGPARAPQSLARAESTFALAREARDRCEVTGAAGRSSSADGIPLGELAARANGFRDRLQAALASVDSSSLAGEDARALGVMRLVLGRDLSPVTLPDSARPQTNPK